MAKKQTPTAEIDVPDPFVLDAGVQPVPAIATVADLTPLRLDALTQVVLVARDGTRTPYAFKAPYPRVISHDGHTYERTGTDDGVEVYREPAF